MKNEEKGGQTMRNGGNGDFEQSEKGKNIKYEQREQWEKWKSEKYEKWQSEKLGKWSLKPNQQIARPPASDIFA